MESEGKRAWAVGHTVVLHLRQTRKICPGWRIKSFIWDVTPEMSMRPPSRPPCHHVGELQLMEEATRGANWGPSACVWHVKPWGWMHSPGEGTESKDRSSGPRLGTGWRRRKNSTGDGRKVDRQITGKPRECNVPEAEREDQVCRDGWRGGQEKMLTELVNTDTTGELDESIRRGKQDPDFYWRVQGLKRG